MKIYSFCLEDWDSHLKNGRTEDQKEFLEAFSHIHEGYQKIVPFHKPFFLSYDSYNYVKDMSDSIIQLIKKVPNRLFDNDYNAFLSALGYNQRDIEFLKLYLQQGEDLLNLSSTFSRVDYIYADNSLKVMELNVGAAIGGIGIMDRYHEIFNRFERDSIKDQYNHVSTGKVFADTIRELAIQHLGRGEKKLAFLCWETEMNEVHPHEAVYYLSKEGVDARVLSINQITFSKNGVYHNDERMDILYGCFTFNEFKKDDDRKFLKRIIKYHINKDLLYLVPPLSTIYGNKGLLSLVKSQEFIDTCSLKEKRILETIPETKNLNEDNFDWALNNRGQLVVKPVVGHGGIGVEFGANYSNSDWGKLLEKLLKEDKAVICQQYISPKNVSPQNDLSFQVCLGALNFNSNFAGVFIRIMNQMEAPAAINCTKGSSFTIAYGF